MVGVLTCELSACLPILPQAPDYLFVTRENEKSFQRNELVKTGTSQTGNGKLTCTPHPVGGTALWASC